MLVEIVGKRYEEKLLTTSRKIAESLGGGGHIKAAGLKLKNVSLETAKEKILKAIEREL